MERPTGTPDLEMRLTDGSMYHRLQMEQQLRDKAATVHGRRLLAIEKYGLDSIVAFDMKPVTITHWILDEMIRQGQLSGEEIGVGSALGADTHPDVFKQFGQRLALFIENGWAVSPRKSEGIDMTKYPPAPAVATAPPNGQTSPPVAYAPPSPPAAYAPPATPGVPPAAYAPPAPPAPVAVASVAPAVAAPPAAYAPPAPPVAHAAPVAAPAVYAPPAPPAAYAPPAPPSPAVVGAPPVMTAPPAPPVGPPSAPMGAAPAAAADPGPPPAKDPGRPWGKACPIRTAAQSRPRRSKEEQEQDEAYKQWKASCKAVNLKPEEVEARYAGAIAQPVAQASNLPAPAVAPAPLAAPTAPPNPMHMKQGVLPAGAPPLAVPMTAVPAAQVSNLDQVLNNQEMIIQHLKVLDIATAIALRNVYKTQGEFSCASILGEFNIPLPE